MEDWRGEKRRREKRLGSIGYSQWKRVNESFAHGFCYALGSSFRYIIRRLSMQGIEKEYKDGTNDGFTMCPFQCVWQQCSSTKGVQFSLY